MDGQVETHEFPELLVSEAKLVRVVGRVVEGSVTGGHLAHVTVLVLEDDGCNAGHLGADIEAVLESGFPVLGLVNAALVSLHEVTAWLAGEHTHGELGHGVHVLWKGLDGGFLVSSQLSSLEDLLLEFLDFRVGWELTGEEQPENTLWDWLTTLFGAWSFLLDVEELGASVGNSLHGIELGSFVEHAWHASHSSDDLANRSIFKS